VQGENVNDLQRWADRTFYAIRQNIWQWVTLAILGDMVIMGTIGLVFWFLYYR
jgi:hypothetical protein